MKSEYYEEYSIIKSVVFNKKKKKRIINDNKYL